MRSARQGAIDPAPDFWDACGMSEVRNAQFPTTHWSIFSRLRSEDSAVSRRALEDILTQYRYTLYAYIRRRGVSHHDAEDALHDFLLRLLNARSLEDADAKRGRLRGYLSTALGRFMANWRRDEARRGRLAQELPRVDDAGEEERYAQEQFSTSETPQQIFERNWGQALMGRVTEQLKAQCELQGKGPLFAELLPVLIGGGSLRGHDGGAIAARLGMTAGALRVTLSRHLRDYRTILEAEVRQTVENSDEVADEIAYLMAVFSPARGKSAASRGGAACG